MRAGYTAFLSLIVTYLSSKSYVPIQKRGEIPRSNPRSNSVLTGPSKKGLFCVRQQAGIYRINMLCEFLLVTAVKQAMTVKKFLPCIHRVPEKMFC